MSKKVDTNGYEKTTVKATFGIKLENLLKKQGFLSSMQGYFLI